MKKIKQTVEEYLAAGGTITQLPEVNKFDSLRMHPKFVPRAVRERQNQEAYIKRDTSKMKICGSERLQQLIDENRIHVAGLEKKRQKRFYDNSRAKG